MILLLGSKYISSHISYGNVGYPAVATEFLDSIASSISSMIAFAAPNGSSLFVMGLPTTR